MTADRALVALVESALCDCAGPFDNGWSHEPHCASEGAARVAEALDARWSWLGSTRVLQSETYGYDLPALAADPKALAAYLSWNVKAAIIELAEASVEYSWKPWAVDAPFVNRQRVLDEIVDVGHFLGNMLVGMGVSDAEYQAAYEAKQAKNRRRVASGSYSAKKGALGEGSDAE